MTASFAAAAERVLGWAGEDPGWLPLDRDGRRGGVGTFRYDRAPIPLRDLPFGTTRRLGAGGTVTRRGGGRSIEIGPPAPAAEPPAGHGRSRRTHRPPVRLSSRRPGRGTGRRRPAHVPAERRAAPTATTATWATCRGSRRDRSSSTTAAPAPRWPGSWSAAPAWRGPTSPPSACRARPPTAGPRYRGRFSGVRLLVLADQDGHDDLVWGRAFTGEAGQRFQGLLAALGITRSYLVLRTLPVDTAGLPDGKVWALADRPDVVALLAAVADRVLDDNPVAAVVTVGPHAERIAGRFELDGQPVVALPRGRRRAPAPRGWPGTPACGRWASPSTSRPRAPRGTASACRSPGRTSPSGCPAGRGPRATGSCGRRRRRRAPSRPSRPTRCGRRAGSTPIEPPSDSDRTTGRQDRMPPTTVVDRAVDRYVLEGRIVTMDDRFTVLDAGRIYVDGRDRRSDPAAAPAPDGWDDAPSCAPATRSTRG